MGVFVLVLLPGHTRLSTVTVCRFFIEHHSESHIAFALSLFQNHLSNLPLSSALVLIHDPDEDRCCVKWLILIAVVICSVVLRAGSKFGITLR